MFSRPGLLASAAVAGIAAPLLFAGAAHAIDVTWFAPTNAPNSNANWPGGTSFSNNLGVVFNAGTGSAGFEIDWIKLGLNTSTSTSGAGSIRVALHGTTNSTAYSAAATSAQHALDVVTFTAPTSTATSFELMLRSPELPNISSFSMSPSTSYSLILYAPTGGSWGMGRTTGFANNTTNDFYTTSSGFVPLNILRNNTKYSNNANSFPTIAISFGATNAPPPPQVPSPLPVAGLAALFSAARRLRALNRRRDGR